VRLPLPFGSVYPLVFSGEKRYSNSMNKETTMKLLQKTLLSVAGLGLVAAAAFPYAKSYLDSLPKQLTVEEAGKVYLGAVCPEIKHKNYWNALSKKYDHEMSLRYYNDESLADANQRVAQLDLRMKLTEEASAKAAIQGSKALRNPKIIWPDSVKKEIKEMSTYMFASGGYALNKDYKEAEKLNQDIVNKKTGSKIRQELNLPTVGKGCEGIK
jgi:hypothetical protein